MIDEELIIDYTEQIAVDHRTINHNLDGRKAFFYVENPDDLAEFDQALRNDVSSPCLLLVADEGELDDNNAVNYTDLAKMQIYVLAQLREGSSRKQIRKLCKQILLDILAKMRVDSNKKAIIPGKIGVFRISKTPYRSVGPMNERWYGYTAWIEFTCPFGFSPNAATWRDIP